MSRFKTTFLYILYIVIASGFFIYYLFPSEDIKRFVEYKFQEDNPGYRLSIAQVSPAFPPALKIKTSKVYQGDLLLFESPQIKATPNWLTIFNSKKTIYFKGKAYQGEAKGRILIDRDPTSEGLEIDAELKNVRLQDIEAVQDVAAGHRVLGILNGQIRYKPALKGPSADIKLVIGQLGIEFGQPMLNINKIEFTEVQANLSMVDNQNLMIDQCVFKGNQINAEISGIIGLAQDPAESNLRLKGSFKPHPSFIAQLGKTFPAAFFFRKKTDNANIGFQIRGTIMAPDFSLN